MTKRIGRSAGAAAPSSSRHARQEEEISRVIRITPMLPSLREPVEPEHFARRDAWLALAAVVLASSATSYAVTWLLARWQLS